MEIQFRALRLALVLTVGLIPVAGSTESGLRTCFAEKNDARRLACYDAEVGKMVTDRVSAHVANVSRKPGGWLIVRLDNDDVWEQSDDGPDLGLAVGDSVRIEKGMLGAYWMSGHSSVAIKVRRAQ